MRILLATDGSEFSDAAADEIARHFPADSEVRVISVAKPPYYQTFEPWSGADMRLYEAMEKSVHDGAQAAVDKAAAKLRERDERPKLSVTTEVLAGSPQELILEEAETFGAELIVIGSHGHGSFERFLLGSVSQSVALHAKCSVEIVRRPKAPTSESKK